MTHFLLFLVALSVLPITAFSLNGPKIAVGSYIEASLNSAPWRSPSDDFAFGFQCPKNDTKNFIVAVWFEIVPGQTTVWFARTQVPAGSILSLESTGFVVRDSQKKLLFNVTGELSGKVDHASITDAGNLVLSNGDSSSLWESFKNPTDTILPTQTIDIGKQLISKKSECDFNYGRFSGSMTTDGNFVFNAKTVRTNAKNEYYNSHTPSGASLTFNKNSDISVVGKSGQVIKTILRANLDNSSEYYFRATLGLDGVFSLYYYSTNLYGWTEAGALPEDACMSVSDSCGVNNVCHLLNGHPSCNCTEGHSLVDKSFPYGDCKSNGTVSKG